jgi:hypothetical protein
VLGFYRERAHQSKFNLGPAVSGLTVLSGVLALDEAVEVLIRGNDVSYPFYMGQGRSSNLSVSGAARRNVLSVLPPTAESIAKVESLLQECRLTRPGLAEALFRNEANRQVIRSVLAIEDADDGSDEQREAYLAALRLLGREVEKESDRADNLGHNAYSLQSEAERNLWPVPWPEEMLRLKAANKAVDVYVQKWGNARTAFSAMARREEAKLRQSKGCCTSCGEPLSRTDRLLRYRTHSYCNSSVVS